MRLTFEIAWLRHCLLLVFRVIEIKERICWSIEERGKLGISQSVIGEQCRVEPEAFLWRPLKNAKLVLPLLGFLEVS